MQSISTISGIILRYVIGILGPLIIFSVYLVFCIFFIESPYFDQSYADDLNRTAQNSGSEEKISESRQRLTNLLRGKSYRLSNDSIRVVYAAPLIIDSSKMKMGR